MLINFILIIVLVCVRVEYTWQKAEKRWVEKGVETLRYFLRRKGGRILSSKKIRRRGRRLTNLKIQDFIFQKSRF